MTGTPNTPDQVRQAPNGHGSLEVEHAGDGQGDIPAADERGASDRDDASDEVRVEDLP
jgi:hypothetical protein